MGEVEVSGDGLDDDPKARRALLAECGEILERLRRPAPAPRTSPEVHADLVAAPPPSARSAAAARPRSGAAGGGSLLGAAMGRAGDLASVLGPRPGRDAAR